jgi:hypothetical protein
VFPCWRLLVFLATWCRTCPQWRITNFVQPFCIIVQNFPFDASFELTTLFDWVLVRRKNSWIIVVFIICFVKNCVNCETRERFLFRRCVSNWIIFHCFCCCLFVWIFLIMFRVGLHKGILIWVNKQLFIALVWCNTPLAYDTAFFLENLFLSIMRILLSLQILFLKRF